MLQRFVSASAVASVVIALAAAGLWMLQVSDPESRYLVSTVWCMVPLAWGLWALLAPGGWLPQRLPLWGALLGLVAGLMALFVLDLPSQLLGEAVPVWLKGAGVLFATGLYYLLWFLVRGVYQALTASASTT